MRSITYEKFLKIDPCWKGDESKAKLMEEIGTSKEIWTAKDVLSIDHKEVSNTDKLWVITYAKLISKKQTKKAFSLLALELMDTLYSCIEAEANFETRNLFREILKFLSVNQYFVELQSAMASDKHTFEIWCKHMRICRDRVMNVCTILRSPDILGLKVVDEKVDTKLLFKYLRKVINIMTLIINTSNKEWTRYSLYYMKADVQDIEVGIDGAAKILQAIATVIEKENEQ